MAPAPAAQKRAWKNEAGERRPKKKVKRVKKQDDYYSDSDGDEVVDTKRASDAPKNMPKRVAKVEEVEITGGNSLPLGERVPGRNTTSRREKKSVPRPKPILKKAAPEQISKATLPQQKSDSEDSDDDDDSEGVQVGDLETNTALNMQVDESSADNLDDDDEPDLEADSSADDSNSASEDEGSIATSQASSATRARKKRNNPTAFATSISKILDTKLSTAKRSDPVLSRSKSAVEANKTLLDEKLESKARAQIRAEKRAAAEKGRVKDVLGLKTANVDTGAILEEEKRLKKIAQRGVVYMFNAVRKAQISAEEERKKVAGEGVVGMQKREERVNEMSKQGFLDLISSGGKQPVEA
ncbi:Putative ribosomal RNA-processing protein [Septoria linicola]|uniref:Ribosomal RNA-processing protein n=1 Tax=Septoria linicola TaxID=215465 RepID=A0A9Q9AQR1_9PEZI|nr:putative ribosomal RNA-processing protein [Septoria linicola]USW51383.1 Putative ribosomal RNA-processing protein [Septoria linicola]